MIRGRGSQLARGHKPDYVLAVVIFALVAIGMIMIYSISPVLSHKLLGNTDRNFYFYRQARYIFIGALAWMAATSIHYGKWQKWSGPLLGVSLVSLVALLIPGLSIERNGATRWIGIGQASFQPAELLKLALVVYMANWLVKRGNDLRKLHEGLIPFSIILGVVSLALLVLQRDMGTMVVLAGMLVGMYFIAGMKLSHLGIVLAAGLTTGILAIVTFPHRLARFTTFLDPSKGTAEAGYHINQALIAIGTGGIFGLGLGRSVQVYGYLPEAANDSIFAIIAEEFGLIGSVIVIVLFGILAWRGARIATRGSDPFAKLTAAGITIWMLLQAAVNIAAMLGLIPLTGIPLPFISYGGSSLVITLFATGILLNISKYTISEVAHAHTSERRRNGWPHIANTGNSRRPKIAR